MKKCELCNSMARMYCESDQASLCWDCDARVHSANFLVTKHSRILLCHACQSLTAWTGSGPRLAPTVSVCQGCANTSPANGVRGSRRLQNSAADDDDDDSDGDGDGDGDDDDDDDDHDDHNGTDEDDGDNQVVPLSTTTPLPPPVSSSSSSSEESSTSYLRGRGRASGSNPGFFPTHAAAENSRFSNYNGSGRNQENGGRKMSSWIWR